VFFNAGIALVVPLSLRAQERPEINTLESVYVTGSNIPRVHAETALPLQVTDPRRHRA